MPDPEIFPDTNFDDETLAHRLRDLAFLNKNVIITFKDPRTGRDEKFHYEGGIVEFVHLTQQEQGRCCTRSPSTCSRSGTAWSIELSMQYTDAYSESIFSYVNNINTIEGGTHLIGFRSALTRTMNDYAKEYRTSEGERRAAERRRRAGRADGHPQHQGAGAAVRGTDQDQAGQQRGSGHRRIHV